jgi:hypothetical protein
LEILLLCFYNERIGVEIGSFLMYMQLEGINRGGVGTLCVCMAFPTNDQEKEIA